MIKRQNLTNLSNLCNNLHENIYVLMRNINLPIDVFIINNNKNNHNDKIINTNKYGYYLLLHKSLTRLLLILPRHREKARKTNYRISKILIYIDYKYKYSYTRTLSIPN